MTKVKKFFRKIRETIIETIFPLQCLNCQKEGALLCEDCFSLIQIIDQKYCHICKKRKPAAVFQCEKCRYKSLLTHLFFATTYNETREDILIRKLIHSFKYEPLIKELSLIFSNLIIAHFKAIGLDENFFKNFIIIPIPLYLKREKWRGFNQAEEIAKHLSFQIKIPVVKKVLTRVKNTKPQTEISNYQERKNNIKEAFKCLNLNCALINPVRNQKFLNGIRKKSVLLIDDIYTSGGTMEEAAKVLKKAGFKKIWGCVVAI